MIKVVKNNFKFYFEIPKIFEIELQLEQNFKYLKKLTNSYLLNLSHSESRILIS